MCGICTEGDPFYKAERVERVIENEKEVSKRVWAVRLCEGCVTRIAGPKVAAANRRLYSWNL